MGEFMAGHLMDAGHELTVHNRTRDREGALAERGARRRGDAGRGGARRRARLHLRRRLARRRGCRPRDLAAWPRASRAEPWCSTARRSRRIPPRRVASELASRGAGAVDAPVSGGSEGARKGQLTAFVGGEDEHVAMRPAGARGVLQVDHPHLAGPAPARSARPSTGMIAGHYAASARDSPSASGRACRSRRSSRRSAAAPRVRGSSRTAPPT